MYLCKNFQCMKFVKETNCKGCKNKCDVYYNLMKLAKNTRDIKPLKAIYKKNENICKQGSNISDALFLIRGSAKLFIEGLNGKNLILYIIKPQTYLGLLSSFESTNYSYSVTALEECEICNINSELVKKIYTSNQSLLINTNNAFGNSMDNLLKKITSLTQKQIRARIAESLIYLSELNNNHKFNLGLSRKELGEMVSMSEENTVRLLSEFSKESIISCKGREIEIKDMQLLKKISDLG